VGLTAQLQLELQLERIMIVTTIAKAQFKSLHSGGAPGARTQNPRIKSPLLYH
jgi:hypothetical protein